MKINILQQALQITLILALFTSCEKWIDPDINENPNSPSDVTMQTILPSIEANMSYRILGGNEVLIAQSIWLQQMDGVARQALAVSNYGVLPTQTEFLWRSSYAEVLMDLKMLKQKAIENNSPHYQGIACILQAATLGQLTDLFNSIPWSEALQGADNLTPAFDSQEFIYEKINQLLDESILLLSMPAGESEVSGDYFYSGDPQKWIRAAWALKARYAIHLSKINNELAFNGALDAVENSFTSNSDDFQFNYGTGETESNPLFQFMRDRSDIRMGGYFIDMLIEKQDPRLAVYAYPDNNGEYTGSFPGTSSDLASKPGPGVSNPDSPGLLITYAEILFIKAEAQYQKGIDETVVKETLMQAVKASLNKWEVYDEDWFTGFSQYTEGLSGEDILDEILTQKYIATFHQPEAYHSWRRTGIPNIPVNPSGIFNEIPRRFPYPPGEQLENPNTPTGISIIDRVWWDR